MMFGEVHPGWFSDGPFGIWKHKDTGQEVVNIEPGYMVANHKDYVDDNTEYEDIIDAFTAAERRWHKVKPEDFDPQLFAVATLLAKADDRDIMTLRYFGDYTPDKEYTPSVDDYMREAGYICDGFWAALEKKADPHMLLAAFIAAKPIPKSLVERSKALTEGMEVDLDEPIEGDVGL